MAIYLDFDFDFLFDSIHNLYNHESIIVMDQNPLARIVIQIFSQSINQNTVLTIRINIMEREKKSSNR